MNKILLYLILLTISINSFAEVDPLNTYRWNRKNALRGNSKISKKPWFEWWYYKVVLPETGDSFYFVYGVVNPWDKNKTLKASRSYAGIGNFKEKRITEENFELDQFKASYTKTDISVARNHATNTFFSGDVLGEDGNRAMWDISIKKNWGFNPVGWMTGLNVTNVEWYSAQADATCSGTIEDKGKTYTFKDAPCYQDRNWGSIFPHWWAWIVSNQFEGHPETTLSAGGGAPTILAGRVMPSEGLAIGLKHKGKEYTFRPNYFNKMGVEINFGTWNAWGINGSDKIEISAYASKNKFMDLQFMTPQGDVFHDFETLTGKVTVKLYKKQRFRYGKKRWKLVDTLFSNYAGIEYGSKDLEPLNKLFSKRKTVLYKTK